VKHGIWMRGLAATVGLVAGTAGGQSFEAVHWKSTIEIEAGAPGVQMPSEYEIWLKGSRMRMKTEALGMAMNMLKLGDEMYSWSDGQPSGVKVNIAASQRSGRSNSDYVHRVAEIREKGKKLGAESVDGHPCEIREYTDEHGNHGKYWLAEDLKYFPVRAVVDGAKGTVTYRNREIDLAASIPEEMMALPKDMTFQDMSEVMKGLQQQKK